MQKSTYLIISGLLSLNYFSGFLSNDILFVLMMIWTALGFFYYPGYSNLYTNKNTGIVFAFLILFFLSALTPLFRYNQDLISTLIAMRGNWIVLYLLTLLKIKPTEEDFYKSFKVLSIITLIISIAVFFMPQLFFDLSAIKRLSIRQLRGSTDILVAWPGSAAIVFYFFLTLGKSIQNNTKNDFTWCTICMLYIFLMQNRSTLLGTAPFYLYGLLKMDIKYKRIIIVIIILTIGGLIYNILSSLIEESTTQLNDSKYNRWQAIYFYLFEQKNNLYTVLFGNGSPCAGSEYLQYINRAVTTRLAILSDIGLLGSYFFYGLITMMLFYSIILKGIINKNIPQSIRFYCLWILFVPTIHSFAHGMAFTGTVKLLVVMYLILYYSSELERDCNY